MDSETRKEYEHKQNWYRHHYSADELVTTKDGKIVGAIYLYHPYDPAIEDLKRMILEVNGEELPHESN